MKGVVAILFLVLATAYSRVAEFESPVTGYHNSFGVPEAERIRLAEEQSAEAEASGQRIVGGSVTDITSVPFQAGLIITLTDGRTSVCGGTLISNTRVVTAAHCQFDGIITARAFGVVLGSNQLFSGGTRVTTTNVVTHPQWNHRNARNDIAVARIPSVNYSLRIQPVDLPNSVEANTNFVGWVAIAAGYGYTRDGAGIGQQQRLSSVNLPVVQNSVCVNTYGSVIVHSTQLCTSGQGGRNVCRGDTGGPLFVRNGNRRVLIGIPSYGSLNGCMRGSPSGHTRVASFLSWILSQ